MATPNQRRTIEEATQGEIKSEVRQSILGSFYTSLDLIGKSTGVTKQGQTWSVRGVQHGLCASGPCAVSPSGGCARSRDTGTD